MTSNLLVQGGEPAKTIGTVNTAEFLLTASISTAFIATIGLSAFTLATVGLIIGGVVAVKPDTRDSLIYRAASTQRIMYVADSPDLVFEIQEVSGGTALTANDAGLNANFVVADASTTTGKSGVELNNSGEATTNTLDVQIIGLVNRADNAVGEHAKSLVRINSHQFANQVAGI